MIIEERTYRIKTGKVPQFLELVRSQGLVIQRSILGNLVGYFTSEFGVLAQVTHLWAYASLEDRARRRARLGQDPDWQKFVPTLSALIEHAENRILVPTDFCPLGQALGVAIGKQETLS